MNDIQHWRRMIQTNRTRTPAADPDDSDGAVSPVTPRRGLKPKISSIFTYHGNAKPEPSFVSPNDDPFAPKMPSWPNDQTYSMHPDAEGLIDSIMCRLMSDPSESLDPRFNGMLMLIFESYRMVLDEKHQLQEQADAAARSQRTLLARLQQAQKQWTQERQEFKAEIKRLELLLAKGKHGLAEVTVARQDSQYRQRESIRRSEILDDGLRTIFEVLERSQQSNEKTWSSQRAVLRPRQISSPSARMRRISQQLASQELTTGYDPLQGTLPAAAPRTLTEASAWESQRAVTDLRRSATGLGTLRTTLSDDTSSTFSCKGDCLPDEPSEEYSVGRPSSSIDPAPMKRSGTGTFQDGAPSVATRRSASEALDGRNEQPAALSAAADSTGSVTRNASLRAKAKGLFQKLRPHAMSDPTDDFRFSFKTGEDAVSLAAETDSARSLRSSMSLSALPGPTLGTALSPVVQSPTNSATFSETSRASRIPVPVHSSGSLARPRWEREDSTFSFPTTSMSENTPSPIPANNTSRQDFGRSLATIDDNRGIAGVRRGNAFAAADARDRRRAYISEQSGCIEPRSHFAKAHAESDMSGSLKENVQPMTVTDAVDGCADGLD